MRAFKHDGRTYNDLARMRLASLWQAAFESDCTPEAERRMLRMLAPWGARTIPYAPEWPSDIGDDHSPFEFSLALTSKHAEVRFLVEAQGASPTLASHRDAALALTSTLADDGADLTRFEIVKDLFLPRHVESGRFALWHAGRLSGAPEYKAYFNPHILGTGRARGLVDDAMSRLGLWTSWSSMKESGFDGIRYFALDLAKDPRARVKVYFYQRGMDMPQLARIGRHVRDFNVDEASVFCRAITGSHGPWSRIPLCIYLSFVEGEPSPTDMTIQIPIRFFFEDDAVARDRVRDYLESRNVSAGVYGRAVQAIADRPLEAGIGVQSYVSLRPIGDGPRLVVYLAVEMFETRPRHDPAALSWRFADSIRPPVVETAST